MAMNEKHKADVISIERLPETCATIGSDAIKDDDGKLRADGDGFVADVENMPKGYYRSPFFIGTCCAVGFGAWAVSSNVELKISMLTRSLSTGQRRLCLRGSHSFNDQCRHWARSQHSMGSTCTSRWLVSQHGML